jgi:hypothetical protein
VGEVEYKGFLAKEELLYLLSSLQVIIKHIFRLQGEI